jgi:glycosyltransferase involved in cell wall biosynthesis
MVGNTDRLWRAGILFEMLSRRGHDVTWWTSTIDHFRKTHFVDGEPRVSLSHNQKIQFLRGCSYTRNVSVARLRNHAQIAKRFSRLARLDKPPALILCSFPTIELSREAVEYGREFGVPVVLDVRDLWPDIFVDVLPRWLRWLSAIPLWKAMRDTKWSLAKCRAVFAVSDSYLAWALRRGSRVQGGDDGVFPLGYQLSPWGENDKVALEDCLVKAGLDPKAPLVCFVGTFGRTYDLATVINAAKILATKKGWRGQIALCGSGDRESEWRRMAADVTKIGFLGWLPAGQLACLLSMSAVALAAYALGAPQGIPNKVIEYLAAGIPTLSSLDGESRDLFESEKCGLFYAPGDHLGLAEALSKLMSDEILRDSMSVAARRVFEERFSADAVYGAMADRLEAIAEARSHQA